MNNLKGNEIIDDTPSSIPTLKPIVFSTDNPDLSHKLTDIEWKKLIDSNSYSCCNKKVGGTSVMCDDCDGEWHIYCMKYYYHINDTETQRIVKEGEPFTCVDCYRAKLGKLSRKRRKTTK